MKRKNQVIAMLLTASILNVAHAKDLEEIPYGGFNSWVIREIKESSIIGGKTKTLYEIGPDETI